MESDVYDCINSAFMASDNKIHVIKAQTAIGKSSSFLRIMKENPNHRFIIAVPTNLLKKEMAEKAKRMGLNVLMTPSLEPLMDMIPPDLKKKIIRLYSRGRASEVHDLIERTLAKEDISCLK